MRIIWKFKINLLNSVQKKKLAIFIHLKKTQIFPLFNLFYFSPTNCPKESCDVSWWSTVESFPKNSLSSLNNKKKLPLFFLAKMFPNITNSFPSKQNHYFCVWFRIIWDSFLYYMRLISNIFGLICFRKIVGNFFVYFRGVFDFFVKNSLIFGPKN